MKKIEANEVLITPELALEMLKFNTRNRKLDKGRVLLYSDLMTRDMWKVNGSSIVISDGNVLLDGQNRLAAIVKSKREQRMILVTGIDAGSFDTIDVGKNRTSADMLYLLEVKDACNVAANISSFYGLKKGVSAFNSHTRMKLSKQEIVNEYKSDPEFWGNIALLSHRFNSNLRLIKSGLLGGYMAYLIKHKKHKEEKVMSFFSQLFYDKDIENTSITILREKLIKDLTGQYRMTMEQRNAIIIMTWNAYCKGKEIKRLLFDSSKDQMPEFI